MSRQIFADGLCGITVAGQTVRLDFVVIAPTEPDGSTQARLVFQERLILPIDGFLKAAAMIHEAAQALPKMAADQKEAEGNRNKPVKAPAETLVNKNDPPKTKIFP